MKAYLIFGILILLTTACKKVDYGDVSRRGEPLFEMSLQATDGSFVSSKQFITGKPFMLFFFEPDCPHCKRQLMEIVNHDEDFKGVNIYMVSVADTMKLHWYEKANRLDVTTNIKVLQDTGLVLMKHFDVHAVPFSAVYDKRGVLQRTYRHRLNAETMSKVI